MRKILTVFAVVFGLALFIPTALNAQSFFPRSLNEPFHRTFEGRGCHRDSVRNDYEWYYSHLSEEDQTLIDDLFLEEIATLDFDTLTSLEQRTALREIKEALVDYIIEEGLFTTTRP